MTASQNSTQIGDKISALLKEYKDRDAERDGWIADYVDEDGAVIESNYSKYDDARLEMAYDAESDLHALLDDLASLTAQDAVAVGK